jgi:hypothetical protein
MDYLSLSNIANCLPRGRVRGDVVDFVPPSASRHKGWKRKRRTATVFLQGDKDIYVHCRHPDDDPIRIKDELKKRLGIGWKPKARKPAPIPPFWVRNQFLGETLKVCRDRERITPEQFNLIINDLRPTDEERKSFARYYGLEFGIDPEAVEKALTIHHRTYDADERAKILNLTYADRQRLGLRRTGSIDVDKQGRERARRDRENAKRRAQTAAEAEARALAYERASRELSRELIELLKPSGANCTSEKGCNIKEATVGLIPSSVVVDNSNVEKESWTQRLKPPESRPRIKLDLEKSPDPPPTTPVPFDERVTLLMQHCRLGRAEAEAEAREWEITTACGMSRC